MGGKNMVKKSLGLIEIVGLAAALEAADAAMKAANVELIGYELTKGGGLVLVKVCGDVGAVKAAVEAGRIAGSKVNKVWATHVIPRPHQELSGMLAQKELLEQQAPIESTKVIAIDVVTAEVEIIMEDGMQLEIQPEREQEPEQKLDEDTVIESSPSELNHGDVPIVIAQKEKKAADICNLCSDPNCHRKKGDPKITCMYYVKNNKEAE